MGTDDQSFHYYAVTIHKSPRVVTSTEDLLYGTTAFYRVRKILHDGTNWNTLALLTYFLVQILHHLPSQEGKM